MAFPEQPEPQTSLNVSEPEILASRVACWVLAPAGVALQARVGCARGLRG